MQEVVVTCGPLELCLPRPRPSDVGELALPCQARVPDKADRSGHGVRGPFTAQYVTR